MRLLEHSGFVPNRSKRVSDFYTIDWRAINAGANPFSKISAMGNDVCRRAAPFDVRVLFCKMRGCLRHRVLAQLLNIELHENPWRILEVLHEIVMTKCGRALPESWRDVIKTFGPSFHSGIKNKEAGRDKVNRVTYCALCWVAKYCANVNTDDIFAVRDVNANWSLIVDRLYSFVTVYVGELMNNCTCNDYRVFDNNIVNEIVERYSYAPDIVQTKINSIAIDFDLTDYRQAFCDSINRIWWRMPRTLRSASRAVKYDMVPEPHRIEYIKSIILGNRNLPVIDECGAAQCIDRTVNTCFVCDCDLFPNAYSAYIRCDEIAEARGEFITSITSIPPRYNILQRCHKCLNGKFGAPISSSRNAIMARHHKWMSFYCGKLDTDSNLQCLPQELFWLIIQMYSLLR